MRALIVGVAPRWVGIARLPAALKQAGFEVAVIGRPNSYLACTRYLDRFWPLAELLRNLDEFLGQVREAAAAWQPRIIIPGDDLTVQILHEALLSGVLAGEDQRLAALIQESLGDPAHFGTVAAKSRLIAGAGSLGIRTPSQLVDPSPEAALSFTHTEGFPVILKPDLTQAGQGVRICHTPAELTAALREHQPGRTVFGAPGALAVQRFVTGNTLAVTLAALGGDILAAFQFEKFRSQRPDVGPVSVARRIQGEDLIEMLRPLIRHLGYCGFAGADFVRSAETGETHLLELNARPTPTVHIGRLFGVDIAAALRARLAGEKLPPPSEAVADQVTLFPQEWQGDAGSPFLQEGYHDVPWDDPPLLQTILINQAARAAGKSGVRAT